MMKRMLNVVMIVGLIAVMAGCSSLTGRTAGQSVSDASITAKINGKLVQDPLLSAWKVDVDSFQGNVTLMGQVPSKEAEQRAVAHAKNTSGVKSVVSNLIVKEPAPIASSQQGTSSTKQSQSSTSASGQSGMTAQGSASQQSQMSSQTASAQNVKLHKASTLSSGSVRNNQGQDIGTIRDLIVNSSTGQVVFAVVQPDSSMMAAGDKLFAIPWKKFQPSQTGDALVLDIDQQRFASAPSFNQNSWPDLYNTAWWSENFSYYGVAPYWGVD